MSALREQTKNCCSRDDCSRGLTDAVRAFALYDTSTLERICVIAGLPPDRPVIVFPGPIAPVQDVNVRLDGYTTHSLDSESGCEKSHCRGCRRCEQEPAVAIIPDDCPEGEI